MTVTRSFGPYEVEIGRPDKVLFPEAAITKRDLCDYYADVAAAMLPHVRDRPLSLQRFPDGIGDEGFYQKDSSDWFPNWIRTVEVPKKEGSSNRQVVADNAATLVYLASQATITLHVWTSRADDLHRPDRLVFDLDPPDDDFGRVRDAARRTRRVLEEIGLVAFATTTGSRGIHVVSPIRPAPFDEVHRLARGVAALVASGAPNELTVEFRKKARAGRLFLDTRRNLYAQTVVAPYSVRPRPGAPVATPISWDEVESAGLGPRDWTLANVRDRIAGTEDPWSGLARRARGLTRPRERLDRLLERSGSPQR